MSGHNKDDCDLCNLCPKELGEAIANALNTIILVRDTEVSRNQGPSDESVEVIEFAGKVIRLCLLHLPTSVKMEVKLMADERPLSERVLETMHTFDLLVRSGEMAEGV